MSHLPYPAGLSAAAASGAPSVLPVYCLDPEQLVPLLYMPLGPEGGCSGWGCEAVGHLLMHHAWPGCAPLRASRCMLFHAWQLTCSGRACTRLGEACRPLHMPRAHAHALLLLHATTPITCARARIHAVLVATLHDLRSELRGKGSDLVVVTGPWSDTVAKTAAQAGVGTVVAEAEVEHE